ncbi:MULTISPECIES: NAD-dependent epimerase/dehydratase family protein [Halorubrum]|uniref:Nucleoside-diphosphate-sugar epimerase n=1 Tax=Halorubrum sodomense TaxID=35743 RepID=A0A1I6H2W0_HALSD|nr:MULTISPECIES: NAD-dependent epimerase/dehydratase family protein [Halorubrum]TKX54950.1 NAD-dependent epimerase/dehydratase family protein [Halorubrum sp. SP3]TKX71584.1 NAD-dependent epimerase/dehydratase family protein [Halorubrum sp. SP9]SFR48763.1 Nucleoside-diphosphate-sugar epimerase [Halorubrum sodomense]
MSTLLVVGGSGFIGRGVCRFAVRDDHEVRSVSRGGRPDVDAEWADAVSWTSADLFRPNAWRDRLDGVDAVVHSVGTLTESPSDGVTFERVNGDAAVLTALEAERAGVDAFVFLSAAAKPPGVRNAYLTAKRRAETSVADLDLDAVILRPGPVYGEGQPHLPGVADRFLRFVASAPPIASRLGESRPLSVDTVARATYRAALNPDARLLDVSDIRELAR